MIGAGLLIALSGQVAAQSAIPPVPSPDTAVVVTAPRITAIEQSQRLAERLTPPFDADQPVPRFIDSACFGTSGLPPEMGELLVGRMTGDAVTLGVPVAAEGRPCKPNVLILFVDDGKAALERLIARRPDLFGDLDLAAVLAVARESGPAHAWITSELRGRDGDRMQVDGQGGPPVLMTRTAGRIRLPVRRDMIAGVVMIDRSAIRGRSIDQIAAYALMRSVTMARPRPALRGDTILSLFDPGQHAGNGLTAFDRGCIRGYYRGTPADPPFQRLASIRAEITREMTMGTTAR